MNRKLLAAGLIFCCASMPSWQVFADQEGEANCGWTDQNGDQIQGQEDYEARVLLTPTDNAPADASGWAKIEAENEEGTVSATLTVCVQGLPGGDYNAVLVLSDSSQISVGQFTISASQNSWGGDSRGEGSGPGQAFQAPLPDSVNPTDITGVAIVDANDTAVLAGDVGSTSSLVHHKASVRLKAGSGAPRARGRASLVTGIRNGKALARLSLSASGLPGNSTLLMAVNGKIAARVKSTPNGRLILQNIQSKQRAIRRVELKDVRGKTLAAADF